MTAWRNFRQETSLTLRGRTFFVGPNASGKSNILDALRFIRDVAAMGLNDAVSVRGGMRDVRSLHARQFREVRIAVDAGPRDGTHGAYAPHLRPASADDHATGIGALPVPLVGRLAFQAAAVAPLVAPSTAGAVRG